MIDIYSRVTFRRMVQKAANYGARAGETIAGNLRRGSDGRFSSAGGVKTPAAAAAADRARQQVREDAAKQPAAKRGKGRKGGGKAKAPKKSVEQRKTERAAEKEKEQAANRDKVFTAMGLDGDVQASLLALTNGSQPDHDVGGLVDMGLAEAAKDGTLRLTRAGQELMNAANVGALGRAKMLVSESKDRMTDRAEAAAKKQAAAAEKLAKQAAAAKAAKAKKAAAAKAQIDRANARSVRENEAAARRDEQRRIREQRELEVEARRVAANTAKLQEEVRYAQLAQMLEDRRLGITTKEQPSAFKVYKSVGGRYRWVMTSSTAFQDRDGETVTKAAMAADCEYADTTGDYGPLVWWHTKAVLGHCDFNMVVGPLLIESGTFRNEMIAKSFAENATSLGASLGFLPLPWEPRTDGIYTFIRRKERSVLPVEHASNRYTRLVVY